SPVHAIAGRSNVDHRWRKRGPIDHVARITAMTKNAYVDALPTPRWWMAWRAKHQESYGGVVPHAPSGVRRLGCHAQSTFWHCGFFVCVAHDHNSPHTENMEDKK